jgi:hypothetical protein
VGQATIANAQAILDHGRATGGALHDYDIAFAIIEQRKARCQ